MIATPTIGDELKARIGAGVAVQNTCDQTPTFWIGKDRVTAALRFLKEDIDRPYKMLYDLSAIDERMKTHRNIQPASDFTVVYHLFSFDRNEYVRIKVGLTEDRLTLPSITPIWPAANWYEREVFDLFGINFAGHPDLRRIMLPDDWEGYPLRKNYPVTGSRV